MRTLVFASIMLATTGAAQGINQVTLKYDDGSGVSGELIAFENDVFRIQASVGLIAIPAQDVSCIGSACPEETVLEVPSAPVRLTALDGAFSVSGNLIDFVDNEYVLATDIGEVRIDATLATCDGDGCVVPQPPLSRDVTLTNGATTIEGKLVRMENGAYIVNVDQLGEIRVDASIFDCDGDACP
ncbi:hypothetical protein [Yoonia sp. BS5-3]|uniref:Uncharacterized protein n=1 Tax=Yoonia phaeophyticola TaxID=3137369 RepID=A0ABZ2V4L6_9RHOB